MPSLSQLVVNVDGTFTSARGRFVSQFAGQCVPLNNIVIQSTQVSLALREILRMFVDARNSVESKPLAFVRFDIFPATSGEQWPTEYATDNWIKIHPNEVQTLRYRECVGYWRDQVAALVC
jgi:hypothetical protein